MGARARTGYVRWDMPLVVQEYVTQSTFINVLLNCLLIIQMKCQGFITNLSIRSNTCQKNLLHDMYKGLYMQERAGVLAMFNQL